MAKPFLKCPGGKTRLLKKLLPHVPQTIGDYYEPFLGGGAVFFVLQEAGRLNNAVHLSDLNYDLISAYWGIQGDALTGMGERDYVIERLHYHELQHGVSPDYYYEVRGQRTESLSLEGRAARAIYLNKTCYNGLWRYNLSGEFNAPRGRYTNPKICDEPLLRAVSEALQGVNIRHAYFADALREVQCGDFVYLDPPYDGGFVAYTKYGFDWKAQKDLHAVAVAASLRGVNILMSNANTPRIREMYERSFDVEVVRASRSISRDAMGRKDTRELIIRNNYEMQGES